MTQLALFEPSPVTLRHVPLEEANALLDAWGHSLGACHRPFRSEAWLLALDGAPLSLAVSASAVSATVAGYTRGEVVELARLCSAPGASAYTRVMLRLWREVCAPRWWCWRPKAAVAYSQNAIHKGSTYRADGWRLVKEDAGSSGGGAWSRQRYAGDAHYGTKKLWVWPYPEKEEEGGG